MAHEDQSNLLSQAELNEVYKMPVLDKNSNKVPFGDLVQNSSTRRTVVVFIRHFFCGNCRDYIVALSKGLPVSRLTALDPPTTLIVVGCGDPALISTYARDTGCEFAMYADPTRALHGKLAFNANLDMGGAKPAYMTQSLLGGLVSSVRSALGAGSKAWAGGRFDQNGGELVWVDGDLVFVHRMESTRDHLEVEELRGVLEGMKGKA